MIQSPLNLKLSDPDVCDSLLHEDTLSLQDKYNAIKSTEKLWYHNYGHISSKKSSAIIFVCLNCNLYSYAYLFPKL